MCGNRSGFSLNTGFVYLILIGTFYYAAEQFHTEQYSSLCDSGFIWDVYFAWWGSDTCESIYLALGVCSPKASIVYAAKFDYPGLSSCIHLNQMTAGGCFFGFVQWS